MLSRVALVEPLAIVDGRRAYFLRDNFGGEVPLSCPYPPLELASCAAVLRDVGHPVDLVAANVLDLSHDDIAARLGEQRPRVVLVPSAWGSLADDHRLMTRLRRALPEATLVMSGPNVTADPEPTLRNSPVDVVILGEPEPALLRLAAGDATAEIPNVAFVDDDILVQTDRALLDDWCSYPLPARDLLELDRYTIPFSRRPRATTIATTRGCAHTCTFCPTQLWHQRTVRARSVDLVMVEIDELVERYGIREIHFRDDTFTHDAERVRAICDALDARGHDLIWRCFATVSTVSRDLLQRMSDAGCFQVCYGFESGDDAVLQRTGKGTTVQQGVDAARWTHEAGMEVSGTFMVGLEGATVETVERSMSFAKDNRLDYVQVNVALPLPGTGFGKRHERQGMTADPSTFRWYGTPASESAELRHEDLPRLARRFYRAFYFRPGYVAGRLRSRRGLQTLWSHARLGVRMARQMTTSAASTPDA